jgi:predicted aminopeptidase
MMIHWQRLLVILFCAAFAGCSSVKFYSQAIAGQREILRKARPVAEVMRDTKVEEHVKRKLAVVQDVRRFAKEKLGLPAERLYDRYSDLGRRHVTWVVYAAPEFSVEGKTWRYPVVGRLEYRGFFSKETALAEAMHLKAQGFDVSVGGVDAYSTLGWFRDPVLNTFFHSTDAELAELLIHELAHVKVFLRGDTDFNEAFATTVGEAGARLWLKSKGDTQALAQYEAGLEKDREIIRLLLRTRERLARLYGDTTQSAETMRREKAAVFAGMLRTHAGIRQRWRGESHYDRNFDRPWNNARLNTAATYYDLVPGFERMLRAGGGDWESFYAAVEGMRGMNDVERRAVLKGSHQARIAGPMGPSR